jgi:hypothetical protein
MTLRSVTWSTTTGTVKDRNPVTAIDALERTVYVGKGNLISLFDSADPKGLTCEGPENSACDGGDRGPCSGS